MRPLKYSVHTTLRGGGNGLAAEDRVPRQTTPLAGIAPSSPFHPHSSSSSALSGSFDSPSCVLKQKTFSSPVDQKNMSFSSAAGEGGGGGAADIVARLGTAGYGTYFGDGSDGDDYGGGRGNASRSGKKVAQKKASSGHRSSFFGRLGTKRTEGEPEATVSKSDTGKAPQVLKQMRIQLSYDEDAYPAGVELDVFALLYDKNCKYLDCVFYRNTEGANGAFSLNCATNSLSMDLTRVPEECYIIVLAAAVYTLGLSLTDLEKGCIQIAGGFLGPTIKTIYLTDLRPPKNAESTSGLIYFLIGEENGQWFYKDALQFTKPSLDEIMRPAKELAEDLDIELRQPAVFGLRHLDSLYQASRRRQGSTSSESSKEFFIHSRGRDSDDGNDFRHSGSVGGSRPARSLRQHLDAMRHSLSSLGNMADPVAAHDLQAFRQTVTDRLDDIEERQNTLEDMVGKVTARLDGLFAYLGIDESSLM
ncbi:hypothetical protein CSUI_000937 [Cystoisospora suis]|uniref:Uncharacterized protein n=1 Tax=Cystoisospora suis TaxID=483139 RepID=A0A2C6KMH0_9APIC|nr:hypothetical protein CSUI_000937 [Cystoisospora suis]